MSIRGNAFEDLPAQGHPKEFSQKFGEFGDIIFNEPERIRQGNHLEKELSQEPMNTIPIRCFHRQARCKSHEGGNYHSLMTGVQNHACGFGIIRDIK